MFRALSRPSSGAYNCISSLLFYRWRVAVAVLLVVVCQATTNNAATISLITSAIKKLNSNAVRNEFSAFSFTSFVLSTDMDHLAHHHLLYLPSRYTKQNIGLYQQFSVDLSGRPCRLKSGSAAVRLLALWVRIPPGARFFSLVKVVFCQVEVSVMGRSLFERSATELGVSSVRS